METIKFQGTDEENELLDRLQPKMAMHVDPPSALVSKQVASIPEEEVMAQMSTATTQRSEHVHGASMRPTKPGEPPMATTAPPE